MVLEYLRGIQASIASVNWPGLTSITRSSERNGRTDQLPGMLQPLNIALLLTAVFLLVILYVRLHLNH